MLSVNQLTVEIGGKTIVGGVTFQVRAGDKVGLVGRNGAGKTTLFKVLDLIMGIRVSEEAEHIGLDLDQHAETAYHDNNELMSRVADLSASLARPAAKKGEKVSS